MYDEEHFLLIGKHTDKTYHLGDAVIITVARVDLEKKQIDFVLGDGEEGILRMAHLSERRAKKEKREANTISYREKRSGSRRNKKKLTTREIDEALNQTKSRRSKKSTKSTRTAKSDKNSRRKRR